MQRAPYDRAHFSEQVLRDRAFTRQGAQRAGPAGAKHPLGVHLYHNLLRMPHHKWEQVREAAHQMTGRKPSPMWGRLAVHKPAFGGHQTLGEIARTATPSDAARAVELDGREGGDYARGVAHILGQLP